MKVFFNNQVVTLYTTVVRGRLGQLVIVDRWPTESIDDNLTTLSSLADLAIR